MSHFQITGSIDVPHKTLLEKAFAPSLVFLEGNISKSYAKRVYLKLMLLPKDIVKLIVPINKDYFEEMVYGDCVIHYDKLEVADHSEYTLVINISEALSQLEEYLNDTRSNKKLIKDTSQFIMDVFDRSLETIEIINPYRNCKHVNTQIQIIKGDT